MPLKCRSCGHLNKKTSEKCERCSCDLRYSAMFDDMVKMRDSESRYLFPLPEQDDIIDEPPMSASLQTDEFPELKATPAEMNTSQVERKRKEKADAARNAKQTDSPALVLFQFLAIELCLFMVIFFVLSVLAQATAPGIQIPNWKLTVVTLFFHVFLEGSMLWFGARPLGLLLTRSNTAAQ